MRHIGIFSPARSFSASAIQVASKLALADPRYNLRSPVEMILGANAYGLVQLGGLVTEGLIAAQQNTFGWTLTGTAQIPRVRFDRRITSAATSAELAETDTTLDELLRLVHRFWTLEEIPLVKKQSPSDLECERLFFAGCRRRCCGRYIVPLPVRADCLALLGDSLASARAALSASHRRMRRDPQFSEAYTQFMTDYA